MRDFYDILGVKKTASEKDIKSAYRKLARKYHPDVNPGDKAAEERFKDISEAYEVLSHKDQRARYDRVGHEAWKAGFKEGPPPGSGQPGAGAGGAWGFPGGGFPGGGFPGGARVHYTTGGDMGDIDLEDLLGGVFGGMGGRGSRRRRPRGPLRGEDVLARLAITMEDALHGAQRHITLTSGSGKSESLTVRIPAGVREGQKIRLAGKGEPGVQGGPAGDLLIEILFEPDARFSREGDDLTTEVKIPYTLAALGGEVSVSSLDGTLKLTIPAGTQGGQRMRLAGKGLPRKGGGRGDLFARIRIQVPRKLDPEARELLDKLKRYE